MRGRHPAQEEVDDPPRAVQIDRLPRRLMGGHQRLDPVHVGVHAAIIRKGRPVARPFIRQQPRPVLPEPLPQHPGCVRNQPVGLGVADHLRRRPRQQHEDMAIGQLAVICHRFALQTPEPAAMVAVAVVAGQITHPLIHHGQTVALPGQVPKRKGMHHPRRRMQLLRRPCQGPPVQPQDVKAPRRVQAVAVKGQEPRRLIGQPGAVGGIVQPGAVRVGTGGQGRARGHRALLFCCSPTLEQPPWPRQTMSRPRRAAAILAPLAALRLLPAMERQGSPECSHG
jgi:hypothetical protein